ncbi:MAG: hypothetical protein Ct9H300mP25_14980 [Acidobacteriota bacterium]|nr:MAG: hypothetical protein Ct9H300mP25_14980 [Acidobacteriota bacterium]
MAALRESPDLLNDQTRQHISSLVILSTFLVDCPSIPGLFRL